MCSDAGKRYLLDIDRKLGSHCQGLQERDNVVLNTIVLTIKQVQLYPENWGGWFFDLCYVFSLPLMLKLWASFSQLWYKLRLLNCLALVGDYWVFKHQTWEALSCLLWPGQIVMVHFHLSAWQAHLQLPLLSLFQTFEWKLHLHEKCLFTILIFFTGWSFLKFWFKF